MCNGEWGVFFTPKNTKSPWFTRTFVLGCKIVAPIWLPPVGLEPTTPWLRVGCSTVGFKTKKQHLMSKRNGKPFPYAHFRDSRRPCRAARVGLPTWSRVSCSTVGFKTKKTTPKSNSMHLQGFEPGTHWLRVSCSTNWAKGAYMWNLT